MTTNASDVTGAAGSDGASDTCSDTWSAALEGMEAGEEGTGSLASDQDLQEVAARLSSDLTLEPDVDWSLADSESLSSRGPRDDGDSVGAGSVGAGSAGSGEKEEPLKTPTNVSNNNNNHSPGQDDIEVLEEGDPKTPTFNGGIFMEDPKGPIEEPRPSRRGSRSKTEESAEPKKKSPFQFLKRLTKFDKSKKPKTSEFATVRVDRLPAVFVVKYLGKQKIQGLYGLKHVRGPVDHLIAKVRKSDEAKETVDLPLVYLVISPRGIDVREHKLNKVTNSSVEYGLIPIDFISYGVQDVKYWRVFTFIVVRELSSRSKVTECHAYLCDSSLNARRMALALGGAFRLYTRSLRAEGKAHNFQVELRPPDELAGATKEEDA